MCYAILLAAVTIALNTDETFFEHVVKNPRSLNGQPVSLVGLAHIDGDRFYLYKNVSAALKTNLSQAVFVRQKENGPSYDQYNNRWLKVTGILDADLHGPLGFGFPCEVLLKDVLLLERPKEQQWASDVGEFDNETANPVHVVLSDRQEYIYAEFDVGAHGSNGAAIHDGKVVVTTPSAKIIAKSDIAIPPRTHGKHEPAERTFSYRITDQEIQPVPASEAKPSDK